jgi:hypothetical protein
MLAEYHHDDRLLASFSMLRQPHHNVLEANQLGTHSVLRGTFVGKTTFGQRFGGKWNTRRPTYQDASNTPANKMAYNAKGYSKLPCLQQKQGVKVHTNDVLISNTCNNKIKHGIFEAVFTKRRYFLSDHAVTLDDRICHCYDILPLLIHTK